MRIHSTFVSSIHRYALDQCSEITKEKIGKILRCAQTEFVQLDKKTENITTFVHSSPEPEDVSIPGTINATPTHTPEATSEDLENLFDDFGPALSSSIHGILNILTSWFKNLVTKNCGLIFLSYFIF